MTDATGGLILPPGVDPADPLGVAPADLDRVLSRTANAIQDAIADPSQGNEFIMGTVTAERTNPYNVDIATGNGPITEVQVLNTKVNVGDNVWIVNLRDGRWLCLGKLSDGSVAGAKPALAAFASGSTTRSSTAYVDAAPTLTGVALNTSCLVTVSAWCRNSSASSVGAAMSFSYTGPSSSAANDSWACGYEANPYASILVTSFAVGYQGPFNYGMSDGVGVSRASLLSGLTPGSYNFSASYRSYGGGQSSFANRSIIVQPL